MRRSLKTFFEQDYPQYEILFCARSADDAGLETARRVAALYPQIPAKFLLHRRQPDYINAKAASMERMEAAAAYEILVISDSDVRVTPGLSARRGAALCRPARGRDVPAPIAAWRPKAACGRALRPSA